MNLANIVDTVTNTLDSAKTPANILPAILLKCTALTRPGLSAYRITSEIIKNNNDSMNVVIIENGNSIEYTGITRIAFV